MLDLLLSYKFGFARFFSVAVAIALSGYLSVFHGWPWWAWSLVGLGCLLFVPLLWGILLGLFEMGRK